jgi:ABC-type multidrug transport system fused ATPase/permease subunit
MRMSPREVYNSRAEEFGAKAERLQKLSNRLSMGRLIVFAGGLVLFAALSTLSVIAAIAVLICSMILFAWMVISYGIAERQRNHFRHLEEINKLEIRCLEGDFSGFKSGGGYAERDHPYTYDLDIFGRTSLFQLICRTTSKPASDMLAGYLKQPAPTDEIMSRQEAVKELAPMTGWRQEFMTIGFQNAGAENDPSALMKWLESDDIFQNRKREKTALWLLSILALASIAMVIAGVPAALLAPVFTVNFIFYFTRFRRITKLHEQVSRSSELLRNYSSSIGMIEKETFRAGKLEVLQGSFRGGSDASVQVRTLARLVNRLDSRLNVLVSIPLNLLFFTDIRFCLALEEWKGQHAARIPGWFAAMAEFEVLSSLANMAYNNPSWVFPEIVPDFFTFRAVNMGHPLIPEKKRINNDFESSGHGKTILITGSNMSGKSTFLRTCGINTALALAGAPVCASSFTLSHVRIHSSMRITDSLEENISSFYAELRRLRSVITEAEKDPRVFLLLDEILRGTNSDDRFTGSVALIKQLMGYGTVAMVATHDLRLAGLSKDIPGKIDNYHFDVKISGEELFFDYKLTPGICSSFNASLLMKKMGINV